MLLLFIFLRTIFYRVDSTYQSMYFKLSVKSLFTSIFCSWSEC